MLRTALFLPPPHVAATIGVKYSGSTVFMPAFCRSRTPYNGIWHLKPSSLFLSCAGDRESFGVTPSPGRASALVARAPYRIS